MDELESRFHEEMLDIYPKANAQCRYNPTRFLQMVNERGGLAAAKTLLHNREVSYGFEALWERGRLDLTVEAVVLRKPWRRLFTAEDLAAARSRLEELQYAFPEESE